MTTSLTYFDFDGSRGLECRLALTIAGVNFTDKRIKREEWIELKKSTPFGALPLFEESGRTIPQSNAILGYIGRTHDLYPDDPWDVARHESLMLSVEDLRYKMPSGKGTKEEKKAQREEFASGWLTQWAASLEQEIEGPFVDGAKLSVADIKLFVILRSFVSGVYDHIPGTFFQSYPRLQNLHDTVATLPAVKSFFG